MTLAVGRWVTILFLFYYGIRKRSLTTWIFISMVVGIEAGFSFPEASLKLNVLSGIFLRLVKTIIAPLIFSTLVVGIAAHLCRSSQPVICGRLRELAAVALVGGRHRHGRRSTGLTMASVGAKRNVVAACCDGDRNHSVHRRAGSSASRVDLRRVGNNRNVHHAARIS